MHTYVLGEMYTRKGNEQQASHLCYLNPIHPILSELFIFIHIIDCGYSLEPFNYAYKTADTGFSLPTLDWEK